MAGRGTDIKLTEEGTSQPEVWQLLVPNVMNRAVLTDSCVVVPVVRETLVLLNFLFASKTILMRLVWF
jgi:preprotein translocase subunit SecA